MTELDCKIAKEKRLLTHVSKLPDTKQTRDDHNKPRPIYLLRLQPVDGDGVRELRRLLKYALRACGLRALEVREEKSESEQAMP